MTGGEAAALLAEVERRIEDHASGPHADAYRTALRIVREVAATLPAPAQAEDWPCDNYTEPHTCLSAGASETACCRICRVVAADRLLAAIRGSGGDVAHSDDGLRAEIAGVLDDHPSIPRFDGTMNYRCPRCPDAKVAGPNSPSHAAHQADAVLAVVGPRLDALAAERDKWHGMFDRCLESENRAQNLIANLEAQVAAMTDHHGPCICNTGPGAEGPDEFCQWHGRPYNDALDYMGRIIADERSQVAALTERVRSADAAWNEAVARLSAAQQVYERMVFDPTANTFDKVEWMQHLADLRAALAGDQ